MIEHSSRRTRIYEHKHDNNNTDNIYLAATHIMKERSVVPFHGCSPGLLDDDGEREKNHNCK